MEVIEKIDALETPTIKGKYPCFICDKWFAQYDLEVHFTISHGACEKETSVTNSVTNHSRSVNGLQFTSLEWVNQHLNSAHQYDNYKNHIRNQHEKSSQNQNSVERVVVTKKNEASGTSNSSLQKIQDQGYVCQFCDKIFNHWFPRDKHIKYQHGTQVTSNFEHEKSSEVLNGVENVTENKENQASNTSNRNTGDDKDQFYICRFCNHTFSTSEAANKHMKESHPNRKRKFKCECCDFVFDQLNTYRSHLQDIHKPKNSILFTIPYCLLCQIKIRGMVGLISHIDTNCCFIETRKG